MYQLIHQMFSVAIYLFQLLLSYIEYKPTLTVNKIGKTVNDRKRSLSLGENDRKPKEVQKKKFVPLDSLPADIRNSVYKYDELILKRRS